MKKRFLAILLTVALCMALLPITAFGVEQLVDKADEMGLLVYSDIQSWNKSVTRLQVAELMAALARRPLEYVEEGFHFTDCDGLNVRQKEVVYTVVQSGIMAGTAYDSFDPDYSVTREQMAVMVYRGLQYVLGPSENKNMNSPRPPFNDIDQISAWAYESIARLYELHIIAVPPSGNFSGNSLATGADALDWLVAACQYLQNNSNDYQTPKLLFHANATVRTDDSITLNAALVPKQSGESYQFTTSDAGVAEIVSSRGGAVTIKGVAPGSVVITAKSGDYTAQCVVTVDPVIIPDMPTSISIPSSYYISTGTQLEIEPTREPANSLVPAYTISSSDENIVQARAEGGTVTICGVAPGTATIRVTASEGVFAESVVTVHRIPNDPVVDSDFVIENGVLTKYNGPGGDVTIPEGVTSIGDRAFSGCDSLTGVTISNGLTSIGEGAFYGCTSLTRITIPEGVTSVGHEAFRDCASLTSVIIPGSVTNFATVKNLTWFVGCAFSGCTGLKTAGPIGGDYNIQFGWTERIPEEAFYRCDSLTSVVIPEGVTSVGHGAFQDCTSLASVTIPDTVTAIGQWAFRNTPWLKSQGEFAVVNGILLEYQGPGGDVVIPAGVTSIGKSAFSSCSSLTSVVIPDGLTSIGLDAFSFCTGLTNVTIPDSVTTIGSLAFSGCTSLTVHGGGFSEAERYCKEHNIPFAYTDHKFRIDENGVLQEYRGPGGDVVIPDGVTSIKYLAFYRCTNLTSVTIPEGVTAIGDSAFLDCTSLIGVTIPASVTSIEGNAFMGTPWLKNQGEFAVVNGILLEYQGPGGDVVIPAGVTSIGESAFFSCSSLTSVTMPEGVTAIGGSAFFGCAKLANAVIPDGVASIGGEAFAGCDDLTRVTIPASVTSIGMYAFARLVEPGFSERDDLTVYGKAGSYAQQYCIENGIPFVDGVAPGTAQSGTLTSASGESVEWSITEAGQVSVDTASLAPKEAILVGCYDMDGRFTGVKWLTVQETTAQIDPSTPNVKLFWLGANQNPLSPSATVWGK